ncbi:MAG: hypothetical protein C0467_30795 [Planctomycetaceae bacterium]|nr:hypothetical protein [Planctomycetaceae bacterium]
MSRCPSSERLAALLDEQLPESHLADLEGHLNDCASCQQTLLGLAVDTKELQRQHHLLRPDGGDHEAPGYLLSALKQTLFAATQRQPRLTAPPVLPGYELLGELGRGGMAVVYCARHISLNRLVALKVILAGRHASPELRDRFRSEAEAIAQLRHPNVVQIYDVGEHDGLPYFSMELIEGGSLKDRLRVAPYLPKASAALVETMARAIHAAHVAGVVHRDLKPANILLHNTVRSSDHTPVVGSDLSLSRHDELATLATNPKIADFGLALHRDSDNGWTRTGDVLGTPAYMAPEQAQGRRADVGPATDIHALGIILYEMLTGRVPFEAEDDVNTLVQVSFDDPVPPRRIRTAIPRDLETICLKCLRKQPSQRYSSAMELADDLRRQQAGEPIHARPITTRERLIKLAIRRPLVASLLVGMVVLAAASITGVTMAMVDARAARDEETRQRARAEEASTQALNALEKSERSVYFSTIGQARSQWLLNNVPAAARLLDRCQVERRGWEWHYLRSLNHSDMRTIPATDNPWVTGIAYSPDGRWLASCVGNPFTVPETGAIQVHDATSGRLRWRKDGLTHLSRSIAYSPDGQFLATASGNWRGGGGKLQLLNATTGEVVRDFPNDDENVHSLAFSPDGRRLATTAPNLPVRVWDTLNGKELYRTTSARRDFIAFTPDGKLFAFDGVGGLEFHAADSGKLVRAFPQVNGMVGFAPDGTRLVTVSRDQVSIWDVNRDAKAAGTTGEVIEVTLVKSFDGYEGSIASVAFRPDGRAVATAGLDGTVRVRELAIGAEAVVYRGHEGRVTTLAFHPDGRLLASGGHQPGDIKFWDTTRSPESVEAASFATGRRDVAALGFTDDDQQLLVLSVGGILRQWECQTGLIRERELPCANKWLVPATQAVFSGDGRLLAAIGDGNLVRVIEPTTGREVATLRGHTVPVRFVACDHKGGRVATAADGTRGDRPFREVKIWNVQTGNVIYEESGIDEFCDGIALSPDGTQLLGARRTLYRHASGRFKFANDGGCLTLTSVSGDRPPQPLPPPTAGVTALAFSPRGTYIAVASGDGTVRVCDRKGKPLHQSPLPGPEGVARLAFNPDETRLAGVNRERAQVWDVGSGQDILFLQGAGPRGTDNGFNPQVAWSHDGMRLAVSNWNRTASVWDATDLTTPAGKGILVTQAASRAFAWHLDKAETYSRSGASSAAAFHRERLLALNGLTGQQLRQRGDFFARSEQWEKAIADYAVSFAGDLPESPRLCEEYAALLVKCRDTDAYQKLRGTVLARRSREGDTSDPQPSIHLGGLLPTTAAESAQLLTIAKRYQVSYPDSPLPQECLGLAHYRAGEWEQAKRSLMRSLAMRSKDDDAAITWVTLALVHLRQGHVAEATPLLKQVDAWLTAQASHFLPAVGEPPSTWDWATTLEVRILRDEAQSLLPKPIP